MLTVFLTAIGVGGATVVGALLGFIFKKATHRFSDIVLGFSAGVMLCAAVIGLILPSVELGGKFGVLYAISGIIVGALVINLVDKFLPHTHKLNTETEQNGKHVSKVLLFVLAIAIHNFPEGIAAGVGFGTGNNSHAIMIAVGIALQNIPEGIVIIAPMLAVGFSKKKTFFIALLTGLIEVVGTVIGYFAVKISTAILPFVLAFAGGTMLYVISNDMIPETHAHGAYKGATYALLIGFCLMLLLDFLL